jgi:hypothetical protein
MRSISERSVEVAREGADAARQSVYTAKVSLVVAIDAALVATIGLVFRNS